VNRIAILDDDDDLRVTLAELAHDVFGLECLALGSFAAMVERADQVAHCELAILDVNLGTGPSGIDAYRWLRDHGFRGRIVFLTGHARTDPVVGQAWRVGDADVLEKPIRLRDLAAVVGQGAPP
jgi:FixJ family two-component response regulator